ncbi:Beta-lactamase domain-containing protein [Tenacibaculum sp. 190130A14a]|uniref:Beta-lactamase domain-containing protein n=1 Tax=Tenacibaculum polynesiense TaxID=3137857 RepID=A0ABP1EZV7_9FLAO
MRLLILQFCYFLLLTNTFTYAQTNIKDYEGHWEGTFKHEHIFNFDVSLEVLGNRKYKLSISNQDFSIQKNIISSSKKTIEFALNETTFFSGMMEKNGSEINGFISSGIYFYHVTLTKNENNTYSGKWNIFLLEKLLSKAIFLSIENIHKGSFDAYPFFGDKRFAGTWCMNAQKQNNIISFQDFRTGLHFKGSLSKNTINLNILLLNKVITSVQLKKSSKEWQYPNLNSLQTKVKNNLPLKRLENDILSNKLPNIHSILVSKNGNMVYEQYFNGYTSQTPHDQRSASKSITSAITGIAIDKGLLKNENQLLYQYIPKQYQSTKDSLKSLITIKDLLTMSSGLDVSSKASEQTYQNSPNWLQTVLSAPMVYPPGTKAQYGSANPFLLGIILQKVSPTPIQLYMDQYLFKPLNIQNYAVQKDLTGQPYFAGGIYLTPRDMVKFGQLYLQQGKWNGDQIISKAWIKKSVKKYHQLDNVKNKNEYGYLWWHHSYNRENQHYTSIEARGNGGQYIVIVPKLKVVCVITAGNYNSKRTQLPETILEEHILPSLTN